ncbi:MULTISPECIES: hypothetical protein [Pantoea]|jgi:hypothetical protein|uniref:DUF1795 domain-containing protein n=1 Tax=Candidatus Pantoea symbiotica TaxID=1884370 RepID=A0A1I3QYJ8_9GAMM|nr:MULTISPECIES: hypothetical protein [Pantoea]MRS21707.1 hypothetical protein [Enterobacteriaceae bacterium RIT692]MRT22943.1 hypothetical protein [Enterobacteriaceae bacterium RIT697]MRT39939.1 hypothetical protein [Enterobacteriaceae bacterium RIT702]KAJ9433408.1 hypothetical protein PMI39_014105 [Pantoea sp. YR343]MEA5103270.1 hypothetical protein [Pantoea sp. S18]
MNTLYNYLEQHDEMLDGVEQNIITVNLPGRQAVYVIGQNDADLLLEVKAREVATAQRMETLRQLESQFRF